MLGQLAGIREQAAGLFTEQLLISAGSPYAGEVLGATKAHTRTHTSIVAIVRGADVIPSPTRIPPSPPPTPSSRSEPVPGSTPSLACSPTADIPSADA